MNIALESVTTSPLTFRMKRAVGNAKMEWQAREGIVVHVSAAGHTGVGEASPLPGFSVETLEDAHDALARVRETLPGRRLDLEGGALAAVDALLGSESLPASVRFALETALIDLRAQLHHVPFWAELDAPAHPVSIPLSALLVGGDTSSLLEEAEAARARGITTGKIKVGHPGRLSHELAVAIELRKHLGSDYQLRFDANGAWSIQETKIALPVLTEIGAELLEEPVRLADWKLLPPGALRLGLDESLARQTLADVERLLASSVAGAVVIKLSSVGGFVAAQKLAQLARLHAREVVVTHAFEGPIGVAAAAGFALSIGSSSLAAGLDVRMYLEVNSAHPIGTTTVDPWHEAGLWIGQ